MMKKKLLFFTFLLLGFTVSAQEEKQQTLGLLISPNIALINPLGHKHINHRLSLASGFFYDHQLSQRFGISTGLLLNTEWIGFDNSHLRYISEGPKRSKVGINAIDVPVNFTFRLNPDNENGYKAFLYSGIMLHREFFRKWTGYYSDKVEINKSNGYTRNLWADSFMNLGFELRKNIGNEYTGAVGIGAKFKPARSLNFSEHYRDPIILNLNLKFGRNL